VVFRAVRSALCALVDGGERYAALMASWVVFSNEEWTVTMRWRDCRLTGIWLFVVVSSVRW